MAEVRLRLGKGLHDFAHKICNRNLLGSHNKLSKCDIEAGFLLGDIQNGHRCGAENAADTVTAGLSQRSYTRGAPPCFTASDLYDRENVDDRHGLKVYSLSNRAQIVEGNLHRSSAKFRGTSSSALPPQSLDSPRLFWGHGQFLFIRAYSGNGTRSEPLYKTKTGYYEILQVSPAATHAQIKTAYYKQSFIYHPDRNSSSEEATVRFSEISEAYTVLGNKALRKKYDRGLLSQSDLVATVRPSAKDATGSTTKQQPEGRRSVVGQDIRGRIFDFDAFYKSHYNEQLQRERDFRVRREEMLKSKRETSGDKIEMGVGILLVIGLGILISLKHG